MIDAAACLGSHDVLFMTLDCLRFDAAMGALEQGRIPNLAQILPNGAWERRHTPASFTYAAHHAFFSGFLPTPETPGVHPRLFAARFAGSASTADTTMIFDTADIVSGFAEARYRTICVGGVGFFNLKTPLSCVLPDMFHESQWSEEMGVTGRTSEQAQINWAVERLAKESKKQRVFLFINISAIHQPNHFYLPDAEVDSVDSQIAALAAVDAALPPLFAALTARAPVLTVICSDHGVTYGDDGYSGHRIGHPAVWTVPYMETILPQEAAA